MKTKLTHHLLAALIGVLLSTAVHAQDSAFTYQGVLTENGMPANGAYDFWFIPYTSAVGGATIGTSLTSDNVPVSNGLFTVTLDFGPSAFIGNARWLEILVRPGASTGDFTNLVPRQKITSTPFAFRAARADSVDMGTLSNPSFLGTTTANPLNFYVNNQRGLRLASGGGDSVNIVAGYAENTVSNLAVGATIGGGGAADWYGNSYTNRVLADFGTVSGGGGNTASDIVATVSGGLDNTAGNSATVGGGWGNTATGWYAVVGGGRANSASVEYSTVAGGSDNKASGHAAAVGGGDNNLAGGSFATIPGGRDNYATNYAFAAGRQAKANHQGSWVWADSQTANFASTGTNQFLIRASGGVGVGTTSPQTELEVRNASPSIRVAANDQNLASLQLYEITGGTPFGYEFQYDGQPDKLHLWSRGFSGNEAIRMTWEKNGDVGIGTNSPAHKLHVVGNIVATGTITGSSDRNVKENFAPVDALEVLERVSAMPIQRWNYIGENTLHLGPVAQDFHDAFQIGMDDKTISMVDADGVALAAIQGLNQKLEQKETEITELKARLEKLEQLLNHKLNGGAK